VTSNKAEIFKRRTGQAEGKRKYGKKKKGKEMEGEMSIKGKK